MSEQDLGARGSHKTLSSKYLGLLSDPQLLIPITEVQTQRQAATVHPLPRFAQPQLLTVVTSREFKEPALFHIFSFPHFSFFSFPHFGSQTLRTKAFKSSYINGESQNVQKTRKAPNKPETTFSLHCRLIPQHSNSL